MKRAGSVGPGFDQYVVDVALAELARARREIEPPLAIGAHARRPRAPAAVAAAPRAVLVGPAVDQRAARLGEHARAASGMRKSRIEHDAQRLSPGSSIARSRTVSCGIVGEHRADAGQHRARRGTQPLHIGARRLPVIHWLAPSRERDAAVEARARS